MTNKERKILEDAGVLFPAVITNAGRIRSMTDEELAEWLANMAYDFWAMFVADPKKMWLDWLKQEE